MKIVALVIGWISGWFTAAFCGAIAMNYDLFYRVYPAMPVIAWPIWATVGTGLFFIALYCRLTLGRM